MTDYLNLKFLGHNLSLEMEQLHPDLTQGSRCDISYTIFHPKALIKEIVTTGCVIIRKMIIKVSRETLEVGG